MSFLERIYWITGPPADAVSHSLGSFPIGVVFLVSSFLFSLEKETKKKNNNNKNVSRFACAPALGDFVSKLKGRSRFNWPIIKLGRVAVSSSSSSSSSSRHFLFRLPLFSFFFVPRVRTRTRTASFFFIWATPPPKLLFFSYYHREKKKDNERKWREKRQHPPRRVVLVSLLFIHSDFFLPEKQVKPRLVVRNLRLFNPSPPLCSSHPHRI